MTEIFIDDEIQTNFYRPLKILKDFKGQLEKKLMLENESEQVRYFDHAVKQKNFFTQMKYNSLNLKVRTTNTKYILNDTKLFVRIAYIIK